MSLKSFWPLPVVDQDYTVRVDDGVAVRGNTAVLRCHIPDAVRDHVKVTSWLHEEGTAIEIFPEKVRFTITQWVILSGKCD